MTPLITFLTDYGLGDPFVGLCRIAVHRDCPEAVVVDLSHDVPHGAARLADSVAWVGQPAVHLAVVDPGVGSDRREVIVAAGHDYLVGPDNGLLVEAAERLGGPDSCWEIDAAALGREVSRTFHGRDVFAPVAARLAAGADPADLGEASPVETLERIPPAALSVALGYLDVPVRDVDRFGNLQLHCGLEALSEAGIGDGRPLWLHARGVEWPAKVVGTFAELLSGEVGLLEDAFGWLAVAVANGSARSRLGAGLHDPVTIESQVELRLSDD